MTEGERLDRIERMLAVLGEIVLAMRNDRPPRTALPGAAYDRASRLRFEALVLGFEATDFLS